MPDAISLGVHLPDLHHEPPLQSLDPEENEGSSLFRALPATSMPCTSTPEPPPVIPSLLPTDSFTDQIVLQTSQFFGLNLVSGLRENRAVI